MKKHAKKIVAALMAIIMLIPTVAMIFPSAAITEYPVELAFNNVFVFDKWASSTVSTTVINNGVVVSDKLVIDIENGSVQFKNAYDTESYTAFSMHPAGEGQEINFNYYMMEVEPGITYTYSYNLTSLTSSLLFTPYVFYFDENGAFIDMAAHSSTAAGKDSFSFTTPTNAKYMQTRFTLSGKGTAEFKEIAIQKKLGSSDTGEGVPARIVYTYKADQVTTYGALPVPVYAPDGYVFAGWYTGLNGTGELITENTPVHYESYTVYAKYEPIVNSISVKTMPVKTSYTVGERVNLTGLVLEAKTGNTTATIEAGYRCTPEYVTATGTQTITVYYGGKTTTFNVEVSASAPKSIVVNGSTVNVSVTNNVYTFEGAVSTGEFNKYAITYSADAYFEGIITYSDGKTEQFFLEPSANFDSNKTPTFTSFIDGYLEKVVDGNGATAAINTYTRTGIKSIKFTPLDNKAGTLDLLSITTSKANNIANAQAVMQYFTNSQYRVGIDVLNGGVVAELYVLNDTGDTGNDVVARVYEYSDTEGNKTYETLVDYRKNLQNSGYISESTNVNLINTFDTGRYLQQSYYGTQDKPYETTYYNNVEWRYNPVQGGNVANEASKVIDYEIGTDYIYIKARPLDWSKWSDDHAGKCNHSGAHTEACWGDEYITDTYMEATYYFRDGYIETHCRMVDYSGLPSALASQEMPAFYTIEPLNEFVYNNVSTDDAWQIQNIVYDSSPEFWGVSQDYIGKHYPNGLNPNVNATEGWAAFMAGRSAESFGVGIYSPETTAFSYGCYPPIYDEATGAANYRHATTTNPANEGPTSYIVPHDARMFESYTPTEYSFALTTGNVNDIRNTFGSTYNNEVFSAEAGRANVAVPETIYMSPNANQSTTGQYFVNNWVDGNGNLQVDATANATKGIISVYAPGSTAISFDVKAVTSGIGDPVIGNGTVAGSYEGHQRWDHSVIYGAYGTGAAKDWFLFNDLGLAINGTGVTAGGTALLEWEIKVYYGDDDKVGETHYAYTTLYSPWLEPVGAATRGRTGDGTFNNGKHVMAQSVAWVSGVHGYKANDSGKFYLAATDTNYDDDSGASSKGTYYAKTNGNYTFVPLLDSGIGVPDNTSTEVMDFLTSSASGGISSPTIRYTNEEAGDTQFGVLVSDISPLAYLTIDTSRYTNFNQIPNLKVGYNVTDTTRTDGVYWYTNDLTEIANSITSTDVEKHEIKFYNKTYSASKDDVNNKADNEWFLNKAAYNIIAGSATATTAVSGGVEYNAAWDRTVITGSDTYDYLFKGALHTYYGSRNTAYALNHVQLRASNVNKAGLRDLVLMASSLEEKYYTEASWKDFKTALQGAANELGNPTDSDVSAAYTNLKNKMDALQTPVTLVANGGSFSGATTKVINLTCGFDFTVDYTIPAESNPTLAGYEVQGWATTADAEEGTNPVTGGLKPTFYAVWTEGSYTVVYNSNNGYGYIPSVTVKFSESFPLASTGFTRDGYSMVGWSTNASATTAEYLPGQTVSGLSDTVGATVTLYAVWAESKYTVKYDPNGGSGSIASVTVRVSETFTLPSSGFTRDEYTLTGWALSADATAPDYQLGESVSRLAATGNITLYAVWKIEKINVTFDNLFDLKKFRISTGALEILERTDTGFKVESLSGNDANTGFGYYIDVEPGKTYILSADIEFEGVSTFDMYIHALDSNDINDTSFTVLDGRAEGGCYMNKSGSSSVNNHCIKFIAGENTYSVGIRFDANYAGSVIKVQNIRFTEDKGVSVSTANKVVDTDETFGTLPVPTKAGYSFLGWYDGNTLITAETAVTQTSTVYLKSKWIISDSALTRDSVVIDFSTPIVIEPLKNDNIYNSLSDTKKFLGFSADGTTPGATTINGAYGTFTVNGQAVTYTPLKAVNGVEKIYYHASVTDANGTTTIKNEITVAPASNVLYEETFFNAVTTEDVDWATVKANNSYAVSNQNSSPVADEKYGYDKSYDKDIKYSNNTAKSVTVTKNLTSMMSENMTFSFKGTGFDLNSVCGANTGVMVVSLKDIDNNAMVKSYVVDTYYGDTAYGDALSSNTLYQVPIISERNIDYHNYLVQVTAAYLPSMSGAIKADKAKQEEEQQKLQPASVNGIDATVVSGADNEDLRNALAELGLDYIYDAAEVEVVWFDDNSVLNGGMGADTPIAGDTLETAALDGLVNVIDSIRVYEPLNDDDSYYIGSEKNAVYYNVIDNLLDTTDGSGLGSVAGKFFAYITGKLGVDENNNDIQLSISNYESVGPKDELYLAESTSAVAFKINNFATIKGADGKVMISLRAASGTPNFKIGTKDFNVNSKTAMYYDITSWVAEDGTVTIQTGPAFDGDKTLLAIGDLKITCEAEAVVASLSSDVDLEAVKMMMMAPSVTVEPNTTPTPEEPEEPEIPDAPEDPAEPEEPTTPEEPASECWLVRIFKWIFGACVKVFNILKGFLAI